jgi:hypothetical protein
MGSLWRQSWCESNLLQGDEIPKPQSPLFFLLERNELKSRKWIDANVPYATFSRDG